MITLSNIQELIERTLFETIRLGLVDLGYLPDVLLYADTEAGVTQYEVDLRAITTQRGFSVELFNEGSNFTKGVKKVPRIIIKTGNFLTGVIGGDASKFFEPTIQGFRSLKMPLQTADFFIDIHLVSNSVQQERFLNALLNTVIPKRKYLKHYNNPNASFLINFLNFHELDDTGQGILEKVYSYEVPDCWDMENSVVSYGVSKMLRVDLNVQLNKYMDGTWASDAGALRLGSIPVANTNLAEEDSILYIIEEDSNSILIED